MRSYVLGYFKSERSDSGASARPVALRTHKDYSVILGRFRNDGFGQEATVAQVFWFKESQGQPARFYVVADKHLSIAEHFSNFGGEIAALRKRLKAMPRVEVHDSFPPYGAAFRRRFGIENEQALDLFHQTVSMKSVGNLTDFVRHHMLEGFPVAARVEALIGHFDDLNRAHEAVLKAKAQIALLAPLTADCTQHDSLVEAVDFLRACRTALAGYFAGLKVELLSERMDKLEGDLAAIVERIAALERNRNHERDQCNGIRRAIAENGGDRIEALKREIASKEELKDDRAKRATQYDVLAVQTGLAKADSAEAFLANARSLPTEIATSRAQEAEVQNALTEDNVSFRRLKDERDEFEREVSSLKSRRSNIPARALAIRERLCSALRVSESDIPFVGELIEVREEERGWEAAAERVLHNFALSLLVADPDYPRVADWVERTHLGDRLVYYRVRETGASSTRAHPHSLVRKLKVRPDSSFYTWLEGELTRRFDYACCETMDQFRREAQALTSAGQIKARGERHEKDDRHRIDDRTRYVLGWSNEAKIAALAAEMRTLERRMADVAARIAELQKRRSSLGDRLTAFQQLGVVARDYGELDWKAIAVEIEQLARERRRLEQDSDILRALTDELGEAEGKLARTEESLDRAKERRARLEERLNVARREREISRETHSGLDADAKARLFPRLDAKREELLGEQAITVETCDAREREMRERIQAEIDNEDKRVARLRDRIISAMRAYNDAYPLETREVDAAMEAAGEYRSMLVRLQADDLPRFEARFKELLNENTIREVANFQSQLNRERQTILERIGIINRSLRAIDYNPGRFIELTAEDSLDAEIRDFRRDMRSCTEGALTGSNDEVYAEAKFLQVKATIERFRGREGRSDLDERWTRKVTDVRNWFAFSASERWREDGREHEHYSDSGGKSGGQKEKLAYTVLAASLAYQFGLEWGEQHSRSFRFVVIDEAFGRGSDDSARYGLKLFQELNLQLLIATPLQKIHVIEPYVTSVGFVHNEDGRLSMLRNLTIEEYRAEHAARAASAAR
ncbi:MAG: hypothetical protein M5U07_18550 [Xanthobacteraceae bacterium]|nr:hypothetical protein [Xanthobacteraceae bacterium]